MKAAMLTILWVVGSLVKECQTIDYKVLFFNCTPRFLLEESFGYNVILQVQACANLQHDRLSEQLPLSLLW
jgi:hypothetical protein